MKTSDIQFAGTDAKVFIKLQGRNGDDSDDLALKKSGKDLFEQNQTDVFIFEDISSVGEITNVKVWHDNSGKNGYFSKVVLHRCILKYSIGQIPLDLCTAQVV